LWPRISTANAAAERVFELIDTPAESDPPQAVELGRLSRNLEFRNLTFSYPNAVQTALKGLSATIQAGETVAVVGPNGSGKTTLLSLIPKFYDPQEGSILIDGIDIATASFSSLREQIGIVTQNTVTFHESVAYNIAYGRPDASRDEIITAAKRAYAHEFIEELAEKYDTIVGEQGSTLSGGQLQRLAIARAILRDPAIMIFDEAMSQIDAESEAKIQQAILEFSQGRTTFIIAHRLSTIIGSDRILVLDKGELAAMGTHASLLDSCNLYRQLYEVQFAH
jgi:ABC-type multidrug transport system fused ATPase/permease subunit